MGLGSSTRRGGGRKVRALPRKFVFLGFRREESGMSREFAGMSRTLGGVQKVCASKVPCAFFRFLEKKQGILSETLVCS